MDWITDWRPLILLIWMLVAGSWAHQGRDLTEITNRFMWWTLLGSLAIAWSAPTPGLALVIALLPIGLYWISPWSDMAAKVVFPGLTIAASFCALAPTMQPWMVRPILWTIIGVVLIQAWAAWLTLLHPEKRVSKVYWFWRWPLVIYELRPWVVCASQGNPNHSQSIGALGVAACLGLIWLESVAAIAMLPIMLFATLACRDRNHSGWWSGQGVLHIWVAVYAVALVWTWRHGGFWWLVGGTVAILVNLTVILRPWAWPKLERGDGKHRFDGGRVDLWLGTLRDLWWNRRWRIRLFGNGSGSWLHVSYHWTYHRYQGIQFSASHNEWHQQIIEYGALGFLALLWHVGDRLIWSLTGGPEAMAVFIVALTACSVATTNFPWSMPFIQPGHPPTATVNCPSCKVILTPCQPIDDPAQCTGSPALNILTFAIALLLEAVAR